LLNPIIQALAVIELSLYPIIVIIPNRAAMQWSTPLVYLKLKSRS